MKVSHVHITLNLILDSEVIKVVISVNDYKQIRQRYLNAKASAALPNQWVFLAIPSKSTVKARMSLGSVKLPNVKHQYLLKMRCTHKSRVSNLVFPLPVELVRS